MFLIIGQIQSPDWLVSGLHRSGVEKRVILVMEEGLSGLFSPFEEAGKEGQIQHRFFHAGK